MTGPARLALAVQRATAAGGLPSDADIADWAEAALEDLPGPVELTVRLVDEEESATLNQRFRGKAGPTNVLSFPFDAPPGVDLPLLGDLVICAPVVAREAAGQDKTGRAHWAHMVIHGVLHLRGYDHQEPQEAGRMESLEIRLLGRLGFRDPYSSEWAR
ncbi:MAG TPA: rRNA maturation RNase YbeY [Gammaproteobacteria bacterium]|nr:rRNA maturation RNase YbeY [Gammaproteobacteria bacterium]